jgi:hypothetical protein
MIPQYGTDGEFYKPQIRTEFEGNYVQSRARSTRGIMRWNLKWESMPEADFQTLRTFFNTNQGGSFNWTEPVTSTARIVRFSEDSLRWSHSNKGVRSVSCGIEEV